jgi:hypothetical protein
LLLSFSISKVGIPIECCGREAGKERITMTRQQNGHDARSAIRQAVEHVAECDSLSHKAAQEWLYREAMAKTASLEQVARALIAEQTLHYQYPAPSERDRTLH